MVLDEASLNGLQWRKAPFTDSGWIGLEDESPVLSELVAELKQRGGKWGLGSWVYELRDYCVTRTTLELAREIDRIARGSFGK